MIDTCPTWCTTSALHADQLAAGDPAEHVSGNFTHGPLRAELWRVGTSERILITTIDGDQDVLDFPLDWVPDVTRLGPGIAAAVDQLTKLARTNA